MKKIISILMALAMLFTAAYWLTSCADPAGEPPKTGANENTTAADTTEAETTKADTTEADTTEAETTEAETTEAETTAEEELKINTDLLDEYMMTFGELSKKYGEITDFIQPNGGNYYRFENSLVYYHFYLPQDKWEWITDPESGVKYRKIDDDEPCRGINRISPDLLFDGAFETISIEDISKIEGIEYINTFEDGISTSKAYRSEFTYDGWNSENVKLFIFHDDKSMMDSTSEAKIYIHPSDIRAEEGIE